MALHTCEVCGRPTSWGDIAVDVCDTCTLPDGIEEPEVTEVIEAVESGHPVRVVQNADGGWVVVRDGDSA